MKNLIQKAMSEIRKKAIPLALASILATAPIYAQGKDNKVISLKNGYTAQSQIAETDVELATAALLGEISLRKTDKGYIAEGQYNKFGKSWKDIYDRVCKLADRDENTIINDLEAQNLLELVYKTITQSSQDGVEWVVEDSQDEVEWVEE